MKKTLICIILSIISLTGRSATISFLDTAIGTTGDNIDNISSFPTTANIVEIPGLQITFTSISGAGANLSTNATLSSFGIDSVGADDLDGFDAGLSESLMFTFNLDVSITQVDFVEFDSLDQFNFGGTTIEFNDLTNNTTDIYDFSTSFYVPAGNPIKIAATHGEIGVEGLTLTVIPEPSSFALIGLAGLAIMSIQRRKK